MLSDSDVLHDGKYTIRIARPEDVESLRGRLRASDYEEIAASSNRSADVTMEEGIRLSRKAWTGLMDDRPEVMFGVYVHPRRPKVGIVWMVGSDDFERQIRVVARYARQYIRKMIDGLELLENYADARHLSTRRWLRYCGFNVEEPKPFGHSGAPFYRFWLKASALEQQNALSGVIDMSGSISD